MGYIVHGLTEYGQRLGTFQVEFSEPGRFEFPASRDVWNKLSTIVGLERDPFPVVGRYYFQFRIAPSKTRDDTYVRDKAVELLKAIGQETGWGEVVFTNVTPTERQIWVEEEWGPSKPGENCVTCETAPKKTKPRPRRKTYPKR